jgi:hypothetical protein
MKKYTLLSCLAALISLSSFGQTVTVCSSGCNYTSIQSAVTAAAAGSVIAISNGTYTENNIVVNKNLTLRGAGMTTTIVQAHASRNTASRRVFVVNNNATVTFEEFTVQHGLETTDATIRGGGGILIEGATTTLTLNRMLIKNNDCLSPYQGAGVFLNGTSSTAPTTNLYINNSQFEGNTNTGTGGGLYLGTGGTVIIKGTSFTSNQGSSGGAISLAGAAVPTMINCSFTSNAATSGASGSGGAVSGTSSVATFTSCTFESNSATAFGGAVRIGPSSFTNCTFFGNTAPQGGAIARGGTNVLPSNIINCTVVGNTATSATASGGGFYYAPSSGGVINMINTVMVSNSGTVGADFYLSDGNYLNTNTTNYVAVSSIPTNTRTFALSSGTAFSSPALANNGGIVKTISTPAGSVLINAGTASASGFTIPNKDERNYQRNGATDIGAFEYGATDALAISYSTLANASSASDRSFSATISDNIGVSTSGTTMPRIYFRKSTASSWLSSAGTLSSGTATSGTWSFTISSSQLGTLNNNDQVQYFVVAQDNTSGAYAKSNSTGLVAGDVNSIGTYPSYNSYTVNLSVMPVTLVSFAALKYADGITVKWATAAEVNAEAFFVERSADGRSWNNIAQVKAKGNASAGFSYSFDDINPFKGDNFYRLKQTDKDGQYTYSEVRKVDFDTYAAKVTVYPNPVVGGNFVVEFNSRPAASISYKLLNSAGLIMKQGELKDRVATIDVSNLTTGIYLLQLNNGVIVKLEKK